MALFFYKRKENHMSDKNRDYHGRWVKGHEPSSDITGNDYASKYKEEYCEMIIEYFLNPPRQKIVDADGKERMGNELYPTFERFAAEIGVVARTLEGWAEKHERFATAYAYAKNVQRSILITKGLSGEYNPTFAKFIATTTHGMVEKSAVDIGNDGNSAFEVNIKVID